MADIRLRITELEGNSTALLLVAEAIRQMLIDFDLIHCLLSDPSMLLSF